MYNTDKKKLILEIFEKNKDISISSTKLVDDLKNDMNKATVYRNLKALEETGIIRKSYNEETKTYEYQYSDDCGNHFHLKCINCGKIIHLKCQDASGFVGHIFKQHGFVVNQNHSTIFGRCKDCNFICGM